MKDMKGPIAWMARDKVTPNLLMLFLIIGGLFVSWGIKKEIMPEFTLDRVEISVSYSGAAPEEIDLGIVLPIENAIRGVEGIDEINSKANSGGATIEVNLIEGTDANQALQEIDQEISRLTTLPEESEKPQVTLTSRKRDVMELVIYGGEDKQVLRAVTEATRDRLLQDENLSQVELEFEPAHEVQIRVDQDQLQRYGLTVNDISTLIGSSAFDQSAGEIESTGGDINIRVQERKDSPDDFLDVPVKSLENGVTLKLRDIAKVTSGFDDSGQDARYNGELSMELTVYRIGNQTPVGVSDTVREILPEIEAELPPGIKLVIADDDSANYRNQMGLLLKNAFLGLVLVLILLSIFLEYRLAFWVTMGIPTSFLGAMLLLPGLGVSINIVSMFAFIIALGIVVDDAIIAGENIYHRQQEGMSFSRAAILGAKDVAVPLTFSILTNMIAFLPILAMPGGFGKMQQATPLVVISVFAISWIEALFILPAHLGQMNDKPRHKIGLWLDRSQEKVNRRLQSFINDIYKPFLAKALDQRYLTLAIGLGIMLLVGAWQASGRLGFYMMPRTDSSFVVATATLPYGSPQSKIQETLEILEDGALKVVAENGGEQLMKGYSSNINNDVVSLSIYLTDSSIRPIATQKVADLWRETNGEIPGLVSMSYKTTGRGPGGEPALTVELSHTDTEILQKASEHLSEQLTYFAGVSDISSTFSSGNDQLDIRISDEGLALGLTADDISSQLRSALFGSTAIKQQEGRNEVAIKVLMDEEQNQSAADLMNFMIRTDSGSYVPLPKVASVEYSKAPATVTRRDGRRTVDITAEVTPRGSTPQIVASLEQTVFDQMKADYPGLQIGLGGDQQQSAEGMSSLMTSSLIAVILIYALLAIPFQSFVQPLLVMSVMPFGLVGAFLGHIILGYTLSMVSFLGVIALCGVVVNDSLMLINTYNHNQRKEGMGWYEAIVQASTRRFRPILLTTLTTFGGLAPMIFETSREAQMIIPMAISLGFGILFATFITLIILPCLCGVQEDVRQLMRREKNLSLASA